MRFRVALAPLILAALLASGLAARAESGPRWAELNPAQRSALAPLEREWPAIDAERKQKWVQIAGRFPTMAPAEQARVQARMGEWARMTPSERGKARLAYQEAKQVPAPDRQSRWDAYQALPPDQKRQLAARAVPPVPTSPSADPRRAAAPVQKSGRELDQPKSNLVANPALAVPPRPIAPTVVQAQPGATTSLMSRRPVPPAHQQPGLPKIAATPEFVDKATLLPQRGAQGAAAVRSAAASEPRSVKR